MAVGFAGTGVAVGAMGARVAEGGGEVGATKATVGLGATPGVRTAVGNSTIVTAKTGRLVARGVTEVPPDVGTALGASLTCSLGAGDVGASAAAMVRGVAPKTLG